MKNTKSRFGMIMFVAGIALFASSNTSTGIALFAVGVVFFLSGIYSTKKENNNE